MKFSPGKLIGLLCLLFFIGGCGNGRTSTTRPNTATINEAVQSSAALATQASAVIADQGDALATAAATTIAAQADILVTQAAELIATGGEALATEAADLIAEGEPLLEGGSIPVTIEPGSLAEKFATVPIPSDGTVEVTITAAELNQAIAAGQAAKEQAGTPLLIQNPQVAFTGGLIILTGTISEPLSGQLTVSFMPYVANGTLQFDVVEASVGNLRVPPAILQTAEQTLNSTLGTATSQLPAGVGLQTVVMGEGTMTVVVVRI